MLRAVKALAIASEPRIAFASGLTTADAGGFLPEGGVWLLLLAMAALAVHLRWRLRRAEKERDLARQRANEIGAAGREAGRLALIGRLASSFAHEINNPLAFVKANVLYLCRLRADSPQIPPDDLAQLLDDTRDGVDRIQQIASDLRAVSRQAPEIAEPCSVRELVERSARIAHARSRGVVDPELGLPAEPIFVTGDPHRLTHLLVNVLLNAIEAVEEMGPRRPPRIAVSCEAREETVCIAVEDNGPGVPRELRERIFEPFFTTKAARRAPGLGLSLSREYLSRCGGEIRVEDGAGGCGARFCVCLVRAAQPPAEALEGARPAL
jgi:C4-dicarboxylate-specific signal transduction histidine kinase